MNAAGKSIDFAEQRTQAQGGNFFRKMADTLPLGVLGGENPLAGGPRKFGPAPFRKIYSRT